MLVHYTASRIGVRALVHCDLPPDPTYKIVLALAAPLLVAVSALIAWRALRNTRLLARQKATLDLIEKAESTTHYREISRTFSTLRRSGGLMAVHDPHDDETRAQRRQVMDFLNHYELVAIGIARGILDAGIYRDWMLGSFLRDWNAAAELIQSERWRLNERGDDWVYHDQLFAAYGALAARWSADVRRLGPTVKPPLPAPGGTAGPVGPGDDPLPVATA